MTGYTRSTFQLPNDTYVDKYTRRCTKPKYDTGKEKYVVAPAHDTRVVHSDNPLFYPFNERLTSPLTAHLRMPNLPNYHWKDIEEYLLCDDVPAGTRIQVYSIINSINQRTTYFLERIVHPTLQWKRIMMTFHLSEVCLFRPHIVQEIALDSLYKIDQDSCVSI